MIRFPTKEELELEVSSFKPSSVAKKASIGDLKILRSLFFDISLDKVEKARIFSKNIGYKIKEFKSVYREMDLLSDEIARLSKFGKDFDIIKKKFGTEGVKKYKKNKRRLEKLDQILEEIIDKTAPDIFNIAAEFLAKTLSLNEEIASRIKVEDDKVKANKLAISEEGQAKSYFNPYRYYLAFQGFMAPSEISISMKYYIVSDVVKRKLGITDWEWLADRELAYTKILLETLYDLR